MNCSERKVLSTADGLVRTNAHETVSTSSSARKKPSKGEKTMGGGGIPNPPPPDDPTPPLGQGAARQPADQRMRAARRNAQPPRNQIPADGAHQRAEYHRCIDHVRGHDSGPNRLGDMETEE